jgi:hypothetical protein
MLAKAGRKTPLDILPVLDAFEEWYNEVYNKLSAQRNFNGYLVVSEVIAYCKITDLIDPLPIVVNIILEIDMQFKELVHERKGHAKRDPNKNNH